MGELRHRFGFLLEALHEVCVGIVQVPGQDLDGHVAVQVGLPAPVDGAHASPANEFGNLVLSELALKLTWRGGLPEDAALSGALAGGGREPGRG